MVMCQKGHPAKVAPVVQNKANVTSKALSRQCMMFTAVCLFIFIGFVFFVVSVEFTCKTALQNYYFYNQRKYM